MLKASTLTTSFPVATSNASTRNDTLRCSIAVVIQTRPPATTGVDQPTPGVLVFQATFRPSPHVSGSPRAVECPWPPGPRNSGQSCAKAAVATPNAIENNRMMRGKGLIDDYCLNATRCLQPPAG